ncbi:MAG: UDP-3-O-(3-hydroxymyristoyl)glucosamine N-acyltransferase [Myxococcaceae bacterium]
MSRTLAELARAVGGELLSGDPSLPIRGVNVLSDAGPGDLSFYGNTRYRRALDDTRASAVLINGEPPVSREGLAWVRVGNPHLAFARVSALFHPRPRFAPGIHPQAHIHPEARVHPDATVMAGATVEQGAEIGARAVLFPGVYVGQGARVGEDTVLHPNVVVREACLVGARVILNAGCVIGADGFGFALDLEVPEHFKIPQAGIVRIEDDVEIGACSCVDRATLGETVIGRGTKIDNLVQIAHNVRVGPLSLLCAQVGVSGSSEIGTGVVLAGQVGVVGHIRVGDMVKVGAQSGVAQDVPDGAVVSGTPAFDHREWLRASAAQQQLGSLVRELRQLRRRVDQLEAEKKEREGTP